MFRRCAGWLLMAGFSLLLAGCPAKRADPGNVAQGKPPRSDLSGPDTALHSYWALIDWYQRTMLARVNAQDPAPSMSELMATVAVGDVLDSFKNFTPRMLQLERTVESIAREGPDTARLSPRPSGSRSNSRSAANWHCNAKETWNRHELFRQSSYHRRRRNRLRQGNRAHCR